MSTILNAKEAKLHCYFKSKKASEDLDVKYALMVHTKKRSFRIELSDEQTKEIAVHYMSVEQQKKNIKNGKIELKDVVQSARL